MKKINLILLLIIILSILFGANNNREILDWQVSELSNRDFADTLKYSTTWDDTIFQVPGEAILVVYQMPANGILKSVNIPVQYWGTGDQQLSVTIHRITYPYNVNGFRYSSSLVENSGWIGGYDLDPSTGEMNFDGTAYTAGGTQGVCDVTDNVVQYSHDPLGIEDSPFGPPGAPLMGLTWPDGFTLPTLDPINNPGGGFDNWVNTSDYGTEPTINQGEWIGVMVYYTGFGGTDSTEATAFNSTNGGAIGLNNPWRTLKFSKGCNGPSGNSGWHIIDDIVNIELAVLFDEGYSSIVINEIMQNPASVSDSYGEWFELFNNHPFNSFDLNGWTIKDNGTDSHTITQSLIITPQNYLIFGSSIDQAINGGLSIDYQYSGIALGNSDDELIIVNSLNEVADSVYWDNGSTFPDPNGASMYLIDPNLDNNIGGSWETSIIPYGIGDFGTPGYSNIASEIYFSTNELSFDTTAVGVNSIKSLTIINQGQGWLIIDSLATLSSNYSEPFLDQYSIAPFDSIQIDITFNPTVYGIAFDTLFIYSNDYDEPVSNIILRGFGYLSVSHMQVSDSSLAYPNTMIGASSSNSFTIYNTGDDLLILDSLFTSNTDFQISFNEISISINDSAICEIVFTPDSIQVYNDSLIIVSNDPDNPQLSISLTGGGITPAADIAVYPPIADFGMIQRGDTVSTEVIIINEGLLGLEISEITFPTPNISPFWTDFSDASLGAEETVSMTIYCYFDSLHTNQESSILTIHSNDPDESSVEISLSAVSWRVINIPADFSTIQAGIDAALDRDTVLIQAGTYTENINFNGKAIVVGSEFLITRDTSYISSTSIDGNQSGSVVVFNNGEDSMAVLSGLTIMNGYVPFAGAGISCGHPGWNPSSPTLEYLIVKDNICTLGVGYLEGAGGILCVESSPKIYNTIVKNNARQGHSAGIACINNANPTIRNVLIANNTTFSDPEYSYGGIWCFNNSNPFLSQVTIVDNYGFGVFTDGGSAPIFNNSIIWGNSGGSLNRPIIATYSDIEGGLTGAGNIDSDPLFCDHASGDFTLFQHSPCVGTGENGANMGVYDIGCETSNDPPSIPTIISPTDTFRLNITNDNINDSLTFLWEQSIDPNNDAIVYFLEAHGDIAPLSRDSIFGNHLSFNHLEIVGLIGENNTVEGNWLIKASDGEYTVSSDSNSLIINISTLIIQNGAQKPEAFALHQNYPNPFNPNTQLRYDLPKQAFVQLAIYDLLGRQVTTLVNQVEGSGYRSVTWNGTDTYGKTVSAGMYLYVIKAGDFVQTRKMILLK